MASIKAQNVNHPEYTENLNEEKYTHVRNAILETLADDGESLSFNDLRDGVAAYLDEHDVPQHLFPKAGSVSWYTKTVQLDLEARGLIERVPNVSPMRLRKPNQ